MARHLRPLGALIVVGSLLLGPVGPAAAVDYPSWDDVQNAKQNEAATAAEIARIQGYLVDLESTAAELGRVAQVKAEEYNAARVLLDAASTKSDRLETQAKDAARKATESARRAGQLVAQFARTGGSSLGLNLFLSTDSDHLLTGLGTMSKLTEQTTDIYAQARHDENLANALTQQAKLAEATRKKLAKDAQNALTTAKTASDAVAAQVAQQQADADQLYAQLASLKGTTADLERRYLEGITDVPPSSPGPGNPTPPDPGPGAPPVDPTPPPPSPSAVEAAIGYAYAQLGDPYEYGGSGPDSWDCSGLTKAAYAAAGVYIGAHGATSQYNYLAGQGRLVPISQVQRGDLIFYSEDGSYMYHTTLYIGGGQMIEAQYEGVPVKISNVRPWDLMPYVARPTG